MVLPRLPSMDTVDVDCIVFPMFVVTVLFVILSIIGVPVGGLIPPGHHMW